MSLLVIPIILIQLILLLFTRFTLWPEMVVYPYLVNNNFLLYRDVINPYLPLLTGFLTVYTRVFGYEVINFQVLTWLIIVITDLSLFLCAQKAFNSTSRAIMSLLTFAILSVPFQVNGLWFDLVQTPLIILAFFYLYTYLKKPTRSSLFYIFLLLAISFFVKQQSLWLIIWVLVILFYRLKGKFLSSLLKAHIYLPFLILFFASVLFFWYQKTLGDFLYWTFFFPFFKASSMPGYVLLPAPRQLSLLISLSIICMVIFLKSKFESKLAAGTAFALLIFAYPRFDYFHLIPSLAILSIALPGSYQVLKNSNILFRATFLIAVTTIILFCLKYFYHNATREVRFFEKDVYSASKIIEEKTIDGSPIYIQNGPDQILVLSRRLPVKPWADEFPWYLELPNLQEKVLAGIVSQNPQYIIFKPYGQGHKYEIGSYRPTIIASFLDVHYQNKIQISDTLWLKEKK